MNNYFISYNSLYQKEYIIPEVSIISLKGNSPQLKKVSENTVEQASDIQDTYKVKLPFRPWIERLSHPIDVKAFILVSDVFFEVTEGLYMLEDGTIKMKVKKKYG